LDTLGSDRSGIRLDEDKHPWTIGRLLAGGKVDRGSRMAGFEVA
jgi:hypothetical protein